MCVTPDPSCYRLLVNWAAIPYTQHEYQGPDLLPGIIPAPGDYLAYHVQ